MSFNLSNLETTKKSILQESLPIDRSRYPLRVAHLAKTDQNKEKNIKKTSEVAKQWEKIADIKFSQATDLKEKIRFRDTRDIIFSVSESCRLPFGEIFMCLDTKNEPQAIALTDNIDNNSSALYVECLVTNPKNIRSKVNFYEPSRVEGAGTAIINHLAKVCLDNNKESIQLNSNFSSLDFYKKLGFEQNANKKRFNMCSPQLILKKEKFLDRKPNHCSRSKEG